MREWWLWSGSVGNSDALDNLKGVRGSTAQLSTPHTAQHTTHS